MNEKPLNYNGFEIWNNPPYKGVTKYPVRLTYKGEHIEHYESVDAAKADVDWLPDWMSNRVAIIDFAPVASASASSEYIADQLKTLGILERELQDTSYAKWPVKVYDLVREIGAMVLELQREGVSEDRINEARKPAESTQSALEHVATEWVRLHSELSTALDLEFAPDEDIERYTEAIAALRERAEKAKANQNARAQEYLVRHEQFLALLPLYKEYRQQADQAIAIAPTTSFEVWLAYGYQSEMERVAVLDRELHDTNNKLEKAEADREETQRQLQDTNDKLLWNKARLQAADEVAKIFTQLLDAFDDQYLPPDPDRFPPETQEYVSDIERLAARAARAALRKAQS